MKNKWLVFILAFTMDSTSISLLQRLKSQNGDADWPRFVALYAPLIFYWARSQGTSAADSEDLVQDVMTVLVRKLPEFDYDGNRSFRGWLRTITLNRHRDLLRRRAARPEAQQTVETLNLDTADDVELFAERQYRRHLARRAMELMQTEFEARTWKACWESTVSDRSAEEIASELDMTVNAVYLAKSRVLRRLRADLAGLWD